MAIGFSYFFDIFINNLYIRYMHAAWVGGSENNKINTNALTRMYGQAMVDKIKLQNAKVQIKYIHFGSFVLQ